MSEPLRIALVAEGPTDRIVIEAALKSILGEQPFVLTQLQPEGSEAFGPLGGGWGGVYKWCQQAAARGGGRLSRDNLAFFGHRLLIVHVDADVADQKYKDANIRPRRWDGTLPCARPCPPARATTDALRAIVLGWCGETAEPPGVVLCMPSKSTEAWVVALLFPGDRSMKKGIECYRDPESRLGQQKKTQRIAKNQADYRDRADRMTDEWERIADRAVCGEAFRFVTELQSAIRAV